MILLIFVVFCFWFVVYNVDFDEFQNELSSLCFHVHSSVIRLQKLEVI